VTAGAASFANKRAVTLFESDNFGTLAIVEVGAITVGTIEQTYRPGRVERGAEKGTFHFGGSTIVLLIEPGRLIVDADLLETSTLDRPDAVETRVRMGTAIGRHP
jgi:phosphatidylserine decarboxylase